MPCLADSSTLRSELLLHAVNQAREKLLATLPDISDVVTSLSSLVSEGTVDESDKQREKTVVKKL
jgi:hypothetical protein